MSKREVMYVAHPLRPTSEQIAAHRVPVMVRGEITLSTWGVGEAPARCEAAALRANIDEALAWLAYFRASFPNTTFIAPWIATVESLHGDNSPDLREAGLVDDCAVVERCDGIVLCGPRISSGMKREMDHGMLTRIGFSVFDFTGWLQYELEIGEQEFSRNFSDFKRPR